MCLRKENPASPIEQDNNPSDLKDLLSHYQRLIDPALDNMTIDAIRQLVREIEDKLARIASKDSQ